ncbi:hypothetical protein J7J39_00555 [bacterium]|nr:hypothetical protein [bacterium]
MKKRQIKILKYIIKEYIKSGHPVSSSLLSEKYKLNLSPATLRIEMAELMEEGYLFQPWTSAGRIPTEKAYRFFIKDLYESKLPERIEKKLEKVFLKKEEEKILREIGRLMAEISQNLSILSRREEVFWQGLSYLLSQPEFSTSDQTLEVIETFEQLCECVESKIFHFQPKREEVKVYIGKENPFGKDGNLSLILGSLEDGLIGILGPLRMDYQRNVALVKRTKELIEERI